MHALAVGLPAETNETPAKGPAILGFLLLHLQIFVMPCLIVV